MSIKGCVSSDSTKMNEELWNGVDDFLSEVLGTSDPVLEAALRASAKAGLPAIQVSANQGRLLQLLAQTRGAPVKILFGEFARRTSDGTSVPVQGTVVSTARLPDSFPSRS